MKRTLGNQTLGNQTLGKQTLGNKSGSHSKIVVIVSAAAAVLGATPLTAAASSAPQGGLDKTDTQVSRMLAAKPAHGTCAVIAKVSGDLSSGQQAQLAGLGPTSPGTWALSTRSHLPCPRTT